MVTIKGSLPTGGSIFSINFFSGSNFGSDIIFHMTNRYSKNQIAFNTKNSDENWLNEEVYNETDAFVAGKRFTVHIALRKDQFIITVNGNHIANFKVRKSNSYIKYHYIDGDVNISSVEFESLT
ncbi:putative lymphatic endothelial cell migration [Trypoxylus dichotomus]